MFQVICVCICVIWTKEGVARPRDTALERPWARESAPRRSPSFTMVIGAELGRVELESC